MNERDIHDMYFNHTNNDQNDQHLHRHEPHHHYDAHDNIPPTPTASPPQLSDGVRCHACRGESQSGQDIGAGGDGGGVGGDADGRVLCGPCMHRFRGPDELGDDASDADSLQDDEGLPRHQMEVPDLEHDWIEVDDHSLPLADIVFSLAEYFTRSCRRVPSPDAFTPAMFSPMASGLHTPSPTDSMIVEASGSGRQSLTPSVYIGHVAGDPDSITHVGAFESAFPPLANFHRGPLWMGPEPMPRRRMIFQCLSPPAFEVEEDDDGH